MESTSSFLDNIADRYASALYDLASEKKCIDKISSDLKIVKEHLNEMVMLNSRSEKSRGLWEPYDGVFGELRPVGSVAYKLGLTAAGQADIFASLQPKNEWDICAGNCIINEAGGKLIDLYGYPRKYNSENTLLQPGLIAGDVEAVDKTFQILKH